MCVWGGGIIQVVTMVKTANLDPFLSCPKCNGNLMIVLFLIQCALVTGRVPRELTESSFLDGTITKQKAKLYNISHFSVSFVEKLTEQSGCTAPSLNTLQKRESSVSVYQYCSNKSHNLSLGELSRKDVWSM